MAFEIVLASDQERPVLFAEIRIDGEPYADVIYDETKHAYQLTIYPPSDERWLTLDLAGFQGALRSATKALVERGFPDIET